MWQRAATDRLQVEDQNEESWDHDNNVYTYCQRSQSNGRDLIK